MEFPAEHGGSGSWFVLCSYGVSGGVLAVPRNNQTLMTGEVCRELERSCQ